MSERDTTNPPTLPARDPRGHKGTFGACAVIGGGASDDALMLGAPAISALGAMRAGVGLCRLCSTPELLPHALVLAPGATGVPIGTDPAPAVDALAASCDSLVVGPGLGVTDRSRSIVVRAMGQEDAALVLDADGLNALATLPEAHRDVRAPAVLTPHPGEFARLAQSVGMTDAEPDADGAADLARRLGAIVVLKSSTTVVTNGHRAWEHDAPNPALGAGGTGDVLAGILGGLVAQFHRMPMIAGERTVTSERMGGVGLYDLARSAVVVHARAATLWRADHDDADAGMTPVELADRIPRALATLRSGD